MSKILLFRGAFDPIHKGHINTVKEVLELMDAGYKGLDKFDEVWLLPLYKDDTLFTSITHRINMLDLAILDSSLPAHKLKICTFEIDTKNKAGLYKTLVAIHKQYPDHTFGLLMGSNQALYMRYERYSRTLLRETQCVIKKRAGYIYFGDSGYSKWFFRKPHIYLGKPLSKYEFSSKKIKKDLANLNVETLKLNQSLHKDLTGFVQKYILDNNLYLKPKDDVKQNFMNYLSQQYGIKIG
jgi:nicotinate-nucleotide adenylyltransferase